MSKASKGFWLSSGIMTVVGFVACILQGSYFSLAMLHLKTPKHAFIDQSALCKGL